jgi:predicted metal-dependent phosphoesterase TrpH
VAAAGLAAFALTDHDTLAGLPEATAAAEKLGIRVIAGCEFSTAAPWGGEMHVLGYFLPVADATVEAFLVKCREDRSRRAEEMVRKLNAAGVAMTLADVQAVAGTGALGRPHVARALVAKGYVNGVQMAFDRWLGRGRSAYVEKRLPAFREVADLVHAAGGVISAAHLKDRATRTVLEKLQAEGLDAVETRHPSHDADQRSRITDWAFELGMARSGGSDWHGDGEEMRHGALGSQEVPLEWVEELEGRRSKN